MYDAAVRIMDVSDSTCGQGLCILVCELNICDGSPLVCPRPDEQDLLFTEP